MLGLHQIDFHGFEKERKYSVYCKHLYYELKFQELPHVHPCSNIYLQQDHVTTWVCQCCWTQIMKLVGGIHGWGTTFRTKALRTFYIGSRRLSWFSIIILINFR
jgi:hypothetical protein